MAADELNIEILSAFANLLRKEAAQDERQAEILLPVFRSFSQNIAGIVEKYEAKEKREHDRFNVFDTLTKHHLEELHSNFIAYLLNPKEKHDFGASFLEFFIEIVVNTYQNHTESDAESQESEILYQNFFKNYNKYEKALVKREIGIGDYGRLDIFIENQDFCIVVENKIRDSSHGNQIERYINYCEKEKKPYWVLYLTPNGDITGSAYGKTYYRISYIATILPWLEKCIAHCKEKNAPKVEYGIAFYQEMLRTKIFNIIDNQLLMNIKKLFEDKNEDALALLKHWHEVTPAVNTYIYDLRLEFFTKVYALLKNRKVSLRNGITQPLDSIKSILDRKNKFPGFGFEQPVLNLPDDKKVVFAVEHGFDKLFFGVFGSNSMSIPEPENIRNKLYQKLSKIYTIDSNVFWIFKTFTINNTHFFDDKNAYELATNMDKIVEEFVKEVEAFLAAWKEVVAEL